MIPNTPKLVDIAFRTENSGSYEIETLQITISEQDKQHVLKAQEIIKDNSFITNIRIPVYGNITYLTDEQEPTEDWRTDVEQFIVYDDCIYFYAQNKYDSGDYIESDQLTISKI